jgi:putative transposase
MGGVPMTFGQGLCGTNDSMTKSVSYKRHRFPPQIIAHAVWLYFRFPLSLRLVEEMLLERGIVVSYATIRRWSKKFDPAQVATPD